MVDVGLSDRKRFYFLEYDKGQKYDVTVAEQTGAHLEDYSPEVHEIPCSKGYFYNLNLPIMTNETALALAPATIPGTAIARETICAENIPPGGLFSKSKQEKILDQVYVNDYISEFQDIYRREHPEVNILLVDSAPPDLSLRGKDMTDPLYKSTDLVGIVSGDVTDNIDESSRILENFLQDAEEHLKIFTNNILEPDVNPDPEE